MTQRILLDNGQMAWWPNAHSLAQRVCLFFQLQPDEELTRDDIALKFRVGAAANVRDRLAVAVSEQLLAVSGAGADATWRAGPKLAAMPSLEVAPKPVGGVKYAPKVDIDAIQPLRTLPLPVKQSHHKNDWRTLLARMEKGQHTPALDMVHRPAMKAAIRSYRRTNFEAEFEHRPLSETKFAVWRVA